MLVLPAESTNSSLAWCFEDRHLNGFAVDAAMTDRHLVLGNVLERLVINGLHEPVPQCIKGSPQCPDVLSVWHVLLRLWDEGAVVDDRPVGVHVHPFIAGAG